VLELVHGLLRLGKPSRAAAWRKRASSLYRLGQRERTIFSRPERSQRVTKLMPKAGSLMPARTLKPAFFSSRRSFLPDAVAGPGDVAGRRVK
jgi:hypothetical protein